MNAILTYIRKELKKISDKELQNSTQRFFKEPILCYGIKSADVRNISKKILPEIRGLSKPVAYGLCDQLWQSGYFEETIIACDIAFAQRKSFQPEDLGIFENWIRDYVHNWASCDTFCNHTVGEFLMTYPQLIKKTGKWAKSKNRWLRRSAAVSLIIPARRGFFLEEIKGIVLDLLTDPEDLVQKGYGWMLKAASESHQQEIFEFVMQYKDTMPRTAFRYAIEKMPTELKAKAMQK